MGGFDWSVFLGGCAFFFFGLRSSRKGLERVAGERLRAAIGRVAGNRFIALGFGAFVTLVLQSSGAVSALLVSFTDTGLLTLYQGTAVLLGADIGTTAVVVLLSIKRIADLSLLIVALGFFVEMIARKRRTRDLGSVILGLGLIFYGMQLMTVAAGPLKEDPFAIHLFGYLAGYPVATVVVATVASSLLHSAGTIGIAIALALAGAITFEAALPIVLGANIGSSVTAVLAALGTHVEGRRLAMTHALTKVVGVAVVLPFIPQVVKGVQFLNHFFGATLLGIDGGVAADIALSHILFNVALAALFLPLLGLLIKLVKTILPAPISTEEPFGPKYLDKSALETPALAFAQAKREIIRIGTICQQIFESCLRMFSRGEDHREMIERAQGEDDKIDVLEKAVRFYLAEIAMESLSAKQARTQMALLAMAADFEEIGDTISKEMVQLAEKKSKWHRLFSDEGWRDLRNFQALVLENFNLVMSLQVQASEELLLKVRRHESHMNDLEQQLRQAHINRLHEGLKESFDTSSIHLDILAGIRRINTKLTHIAEMSMEA